MFKNIENLRIENIYKGTSKRQGSVRKRNYNSFVFRTAGCVKYTFPETYIEAEKGKILFLPKGCSYDYACVADTPCEYIIISFDAKLENAAPFSYPLESFQDMDEFTNNLTDLWKFGGRAEHYRCYSVFYNLLAHLENLENLTYIDKKKADIISPAVLYLKKHIYDCELKVETLVSLCGISDTYFQQIFKANYGTTPQKFILAKRLSHAKAVIDSGDFDTISQVASSVGYSDPLYFSRAFKKKYGLSPVQYVKG